MEQSQGYVFNDINRVSEELHRRIDGEIKRTDELYRETNGYINGRMDDVDKMFGGVYRNFDSRLDKLTNKLNPVKKDLLQD